jgi:hypothetical protein
VEAVCYSETSVNIYRNHRVIYVKRIRFVVTAVRESNMFLVSQNFTGNARRKGTGRKT